MAPSDQLTFKITHTTDPNLPYRVISIPKATPITALIKYSTEEFNLITSKSVSLKDIEEQKIPSSMVSKQSFY